MSRKAANTTEEEPITQSELIEESGETVSEGAIAQAVNDSAEVVVPAVSSVNPKAAVVKANKAGKMGVYKFLSLYPQDIYTEALLKLYYPKSVFTKDEWFQRIEELNNMPIYN